MNQKKIFGYMEIIIVYTLLFIIDINKKYFGYVFFNPNPYFIFSLFVAIRYGINFALLSGIISTAYLALSLFLNAEEEFFNLFISWEVLKIPLFIFSLGFIIGFFRDMYIQKIESQEEKISMLGQKMDSLEDEIRKYKNLTSDLEKKLILEKKGVSLLVERLKEIDYGNSEDIFNEAIELIFDFIEAKTVSIYTLSENDFLRMKVRKGQQFLPNSFDLNKSVVISMAKKFGSANANVLYLTETDYNPEFEPAMAVAISSENEILGFVIVEIIDPEKINKNTETYLKVLSDWLSTLLLATQNLVGSSNERVLQSSERFDSIMKYIDERRQRFSIPYSIITAKIKGDIQIKQLNKAIRNTDFIFYDDSKKELKILLTVCPKRGLERILESIRKIKGLEILEAYTKE